MQSQALVFHASELSTRMPASVSLPLASVTVLLLIVTTGAGPLEDH